MSPARIPRLVVLLRGVPLPAVAALLCLAAYAGTLTAGFVYDDYPYVVDNADLNGGWSRLPRLLASSFPAHAPERGLYRPLTAATYLLDRVGGGPDPARHHATNVLLAALLVLSVHAALRRVLPAPAAAAGAFLFAVHPVHVEAIAWITGRAEILGALFACLAFAWGADAARGPGGWGSAVRGAVALFLGIVSKENAAVALLLLGLHLRLSRPAGEGRGIGALALVPLGGAAAAALTMRFAALGAFAPAAGHRVGPGDLVSRLPLIVAATGEHLRLLLWPHPLSVERMPVVPREWGEGAVIGGLVVLVVWGVLTRAMRRDPSRLLLALWGPVALLPVLQVIPIGETVAERFLLLPSVGVAGLLGAGLVGVGGPRRLRQAVLVALLAGGLAGTVRGAAVWRDETTLWRHALRHAPRSAGAWAGLGDASVHRDRPGEAIPHYRRALELDPGLTVARLALAAALEATGQAEAALAESREAVRGDPANPVALNNLGARLARAGRLGEAETLFGRAVEVSPRYAPALRNAALVALDTGRPADARRLLARARAADPLLPGLDEIARRIAGAPSPDPGQGR